MTGIEVIVWLGQKQVELYKQAPETYIRAFTGGSCNRAIMNSYYGVLVRKGLIIPLEATGEEYKTELKRMAWEYSDGKLDIPGMVTMAKLIHIIAHESNSRGNI